MDPRGTWAKCVCMVKRGAEAARERACRVVRAALFDVGSITRVYSSEERQRHGSEERGSRGGKTGESRTEEEARRVAAGVRLVEVKPAPYFPSERRRRADVYLATGVRADESGLDIP